MSLGIFYAHCLSHGLFLYRVLLPDRPKDYHLLARGSRLASTSNSALRSGWTWCEIPCRQPWCESWVLAHKTIRGEVSDWHSDPGEVSRVGFMSPPTPFSIFGPWATSSYWKLECLGLGSLHPDGGPLPGLCRADVIVGVENDLELTCTSSLWLCLLTDWPNSEGLTEGQFTRNKKAALLGPFSEDLLNIQGLARFCDSVNKYIY